MEAKNSNGFFSGCFSGVVVVGWDFLHYFVHLKSVSQKIISSELV